PAYPFDNIIFFYKTVVNEVMTLQPGQCQGAVGLAKVALGIISGQQGGNAPLPDGPGPGGVEPGQLVVAGKQLVIAVEQIIGLALKGGEKLPVIIGKQLGSTAVGTIRPVQILPATQ